VYWARFVKRSGGSPGVISLFLQNDFYKTREEYLSALADAMKTEYETIVASGLDLQLDCPDLALSRHMLFNDLSDDELFIFVGEITKGLIVVIFPWIKCFLP